MSGAKGTAGHLAPPNGGNGNSCAAMHKLEKTLVGASPAMAELRYLVAQVAPSEASVLISGPSGAGKEMVARAIHAMSNRSGKDYVAVNCGAIPRDLLESELFGHEKGSFTGAHAQYRGRFEEAHGGTLFLDEIGDMPADMQVKLLRVLEERAIQRVGGRGQIAIDTRIISATHRDIDAAIDHGSFREDLFYRLAVFPLLVPSLAERREDVPQLIRHFLDRSPMGRSVSFTDAAIARLVAHDWPGNVRELRNLVDRATIMFPNQTIAAEQIEGIMFRRGRISPSEQNALWTATDNIARFAPPLPVESQPVAATDVPTAQNDFHPPKMTMAQPVDLATIVAEFERHYVAEALRRTNGNVSEAARLLSLQRTTLIGKMQKYDMPRSAA